MCMTILTATDGTKFLIDPEDKERVSKFNWTPMHTPYNTYIRRITKERKTVLLHHFVLGIEKPRNNYHIHHLDSNGKNCCKSNLVEMQISQHLATARDRENKSGFRGAYPKGDKFQSQIRYKGKDRYLGIFDSADEAHKTFLIARKMLRGF